MKIEAAVRQARAKPLPRMQKDILDCLEAHPDEVFPYRDAGLAKAIGVKDSALRFSLWALARRGLIRSIRVGRRVYFGSSQAIARAERLTRVEGRMPRQSKGVMAEAKELRERIRRRVGFVDGLKLLEKSRSRHI